MKYTAPLLLLLNVFPGGASQAWAQPEISSLTNGIEEAGDLPVIALQRRSLTCGTGPSPSCTGTLVSPRLVLTAAHCVDNGIAEAVQVFSGANTDGPGDKLYPTDVWMHPEWVEATRENDIALLLLPYAVADPPVLLLESVDASLVGSTVRLVGFGTDGVNTQTGVKRSGTAVISEVGDGDFRITPSPSMTCDADSGGPVFVTVDNVEYVAGVTSWGDDDCVEFGVNTRVDVHLAEFLLPAIASAENLPETGDISPIDTSTDAVCEVTCASDDDCPAGLRCSEREDGMLCRYDDLPNGYLSGDTCASEDGCEGGMCVALERGGQPECTCYTLCDASVSDLPKKDGCGCASGGPSQSYLAFVPLLLLVRRRLLGVVKPLPA